MRSIIILLLSSFCLWSAQAQKGSPEASQAAGFELTIKVNNYPKKAKLSLGRYYADKQYLVDTGVFDAKRGVYTIRRDEPLEGGMYMLITHENVPLELIIDKNQHFSIETDFPNFGERVVYKNSAENQLYMDFNDSVRQYYLLMDSLQKGYSGIEAKSDEARVMFDKVQEPLKLIEKVKEAFMLQNPTHLMTAVFRAQKEVPIPDAPIEITDEAKRREWRYYYYKDHFWDHFDLQDPRILYTPLFHQKLDYFSEKVVSPHPDTLKFELERLVERTRGCKPLFQYTIWWAVDKYQRSQIIGYDAIWVHLAKRYYLGGDAFWATPSTIESFKKRITLEEPLLIGNRPPEFLCPDTNAGRPNEGWISVFAPKTRYTIIIFWSPTCGHCKKQMPLLRDFYKEKGKSLDFEVYAVGREGTVESWKEYLYANDLMHWVNVYGQSSTIQYNEVWDAHSSPTIYVLDGEKRIVTKKIDVDKIEPFILNWNELYYPAASSK